MKVLIAVDNSDFSSRVVREIASRIWSANTEILVLSVMKNCTLPGSTDRFMQQRTILLESLLTTLNTKLTNCKISFEVVEGNAADEIISFAKKWQADLIVMGAHGESGIARRKIGNVVVSVLNAAPCSVEIVKPRRSILASVDKVSRSLKSVSKTI
ncbi:universal stress protein [soil metagenome]